MQLTEITYAHAQPIAGYGPDFFRIGAHILGGASIVTPWDAGAWGGLSDLDRPLMLGAKIDVILLGMGAQIAHAPQGFRHAIETAGMGLEVMDTPAACRTYNILLSEGRRIAALLLPIGVK